MSVSVRMPLHVPATPTRGGSTQRGAGVAAPTAALQVNGAPGWEDPVDCRSQALDLSGDGLVDHVALDTTGDGKLDAVLPIMHRDSSQGRVQVRSREPGRLVVLTFETGKRRKQQLMTKGDVLKLSRRALRPALGRAQRERTGDSSGKRGGGSTPVETPIRDSHGGPFGVFGLPGGRPPNAKAAPRYLHSRDLRKLDTALGDTSEPVIMARVDAILFMIPPVRAVIMCDKCLIFLQTADGDDQILDVLNERLDPGENSNATAGGGLDAAEVLQELEAPGDVDDSPFEIRSLEAVLETVLVGFSREVGALEVEAKAVLKAILRKPTRKVLEQLRRVKNDTDLCYNRAKGARNELNEILEEDEDMAMMHLTALRDNIHLLDDLQSFDVEDIEILLEAYLQDLQGVCNRLKKINDDIENTEALVEIQLDTARNRLLTFGFVFNVIAASCSLFALITGIFGMNLRNDWEDSSAAFQVVVALVVIGVLGSPAVLMYLFSRMGLTKFL